MPSYRKKPVVVQAEQFEPTRKPWPEGVEQWEEMICNDTGFLVETRYHWRIETLRGPAAVVRPGDWIITDTEGERCSCDPRTFEDTYERVEDSDA